MNCNGKISAAMKFSSDLDKEMSPIMTTANGGGSLSTKGFVLNDNPAMTQTGQPVEKCRVKPFKYFQLENRLQD